MVQHVHAFQRWRVRVDRYELLVWKEACCTSGPLTELHAWWSLRLERIRANRSHQWDIAAVHAVQRAPARCWLEAHRGRDSRHRRHTWHGRHRRHAWHSCRHAGHSPMSHLPLRQVQHRRASHCLQVEGWLLGMVHLLWVARRVCFGLPASLDSGCRWRWHRWRWWQLQALGRIATIAAHHR